MTADLIKDKGGWIIKSSDAGSTGGLTGGSRAGVVIRGGNDAMDFLMAIDRASAGVSYNFTRSDGSSIKAYPSDKKKGSIVIERAVGNWVRLNPGDAADLRLNVIRKIAQSDEEGVKIPNSEDAKEFLMAIDKASAGVSYNFTRSDGSSIKAYSSDKKKGSIVIEDDGKIVLLDPNDIVDFRLNVMGKIR